MPGASDYNHDSDVTLVDHPLNLNPDSKWQTFFKDNEVLSQIDKDVRRLCPDISFFQQACDFPCEAVVQSKGVKRLHKRVQRTVLKSANVERRGLGVTKVCKNLHFSSASEKFLFFCLSLDCCSSIPAAGKLRIIGGKKKKLSLKFKS